MIIAYHLAPYYGVGHFFNGQEPAGVLCRECDCVLDDEYVPKRVSIRRPYEVASTYDNRTIVSERFKRFCDNERLKRVQFILVNERRKLYLLRPRKVLQLDISRSNTRFGKICRSCGQHEFVVGIDGIRLRDIRKPIRRGLYRSDLLFASNRGKRPLHVVGIETRDRILEEHFRGVLFEPLTVD